MLIHLMPSLVRWMEDVTSIYLPTLGKANLASPMQGTDHPASHIVWPKGEGLLVTIVVRRVSFLCHQSPCHHTWSQLGHSLLSLVGFFSVAAKESYCQFATSEATAVAVTRRLLHHCHRHCCLLRHCHCWWRRAPRSHLVGADAPRISRIPIPSHLFNPSKVDICTGLWEDLSWLKIDVSLTDTLMKYHDRKLINSQSLKKTSIGKQRFLSGIARIT